MRNIDYIAIHCSATQPNATVEAIKRYWKEELKWEVVGYHYIIESNGNVVDLLTIGSVSNGVMGFNHCTINVCYIGGVDENNNPKDTRTDAQKASLSKVIRELKNKFPNAKIQGHRDFPNVKKACPSFDAKTEYKYIK